ncbi:DUF6461 domain-containing protein [Umezawaea sp. Da 62-37]|uniref:DUF6461 domain-containing protein n=1 Tax=Umezawaea sp. Da 62-37 TaxID=3075927 RepID=UPI0028F71ED9|nr:DUF6461 domain-containing protein [Umezawaea sp. Da 62-37]WNV90159.1 DUF6461 domain-containing protein [Umezawaea sp. Da 62-37]
MDHDLASAVARSIPLVLEHIPLGAAAELGGLAVTPGRARRRKRGSAVVNAVRGLESAGRLAGALEQVVDALRVPVPPELVRHLEARRGTFGFAYADSGDETAKALRLLEICHPGAVEVVAEVVAGLVGDDAVAPLLRVDAGGDGEAVAARHGAAHLALCAVVSAGVLRALGEDWSVTTAAVVGTAIGTAALLLPGLPMPDCHAAAVLAKRRAEYRYPHWSSASPPVRDHRFALAEGDVPEEVDFSANGLVVAVPGGAVVRTGLAEGVASVALHVLEGPPDGIDLEGWDEVVETTWTAEVGSARLGGPTSGQGRRAEAPPWPGEYRLLVRATGRDDGDEEQYSLTTWRAPAAPDVVHLRTDRLGHRLRGEPEPPVVVAPEAAHRWVSGSTLDQAAAITVVVGSPVDEVVRAFGGDPADPRPADRLREDFTRSWIAVAAVGDAVVVFEENGVLGTREEVIGPLSRKGRVASAFWNVNALTLLSFARDGEVLASFEPGPCPSDDPEVRTAFDAVDLQDLRHQEAKLLTAAARFAGQVVTADDLASAVGYEVEEQA